MTDKEGPSPELHESPEEDTVVLPASATRPVGDSPQRADRSKANLSRTGLDHYATVPLGPVGDKDFCIDEEQLQRVLLEDGIALEAFIGKGSSGYVYRGYNRSLHRPCAVKILRPDRENEEGFADFFWREAGTLGSLGHHDHIINIYHTRHQGGYFYLILEYLQKSLADELQHRGGSLPVLETKEILLQVFSALEYTHKKDVVHCDLKPQNLLLANDGTVKISDFGVARMARFGERGGLAGTIGYIAPEVMQGGSPSVKSDLFAMGVIASLLLTGRLPESGKVKLKPTLGVLAKPWEVFITRLLQPDPTQRTSSATEALAELRALPAETPSSSSLVPLLLTLVGVAGLSAYTYHSWSDFRAWVDARIPAPLSSAFQSISPLPGQESNGGAGSVDKPSPAQPPNMGPSPEAFPQMPSRTPESMAELVARSFGGVEAVVKLELHDGSERIGKRSFQAGERFGLLVDASTDLHFVILEYQSETVTLLWPPDSRQVLQKAGPGMPFATEPVVIEPPFGASVLQVMGSADRNLPESILGLFGPSRKVGFEAFHTELEGIKRSGQGEAPLQAIFVSGLKLHISP